MRIASIHQPNFFPWLGFFHKIAHSDVFVILDHVVNRPNDAIYTKRVQIMVSGKPFWLTVPLSKPSGVEFVPINEMKIDWTTKFSDKHVKTFINSYKKAPFFAEVFPVVERFYASQAENISALNIEFINSIVEKLELRTEIWKSSELGGMGNASDLLIDLCLKTKADVYIYGGKGADYQEEDKFQQSGISLRAQDFVHPPYRQFNSPEFIPGLSIVDALMNVGFNGVKQLLSA